MKIENSKLKIAVLAGGVGAERQVSIESGKCVTSALKNAGLNVVSSDIRPDNMDILGDDGIDVFFLALHGQFGEDGQLQQILKDKGLCYTGSGPRASGLAFDKMAAKGAFIKAGILTPAAIKFDSNANPTELEKQLEQLADRYVVKPITQGSSIGVSIADDPHKAVAAAQKCLGEFGDCMIEKFIQGRELTVGILCGQALPIIEIRPKTGFYDYHAKYIDEKTEFLFDTISDPIPAADIRAAAIACFDSLGCRHFARVDFILGDDGVAYALEVNTIPGFTSHSLLPRAAAKAGFSMSDLCVKVIEAALEEKNSRRPAGDKIRNR